MFPDITPKKAPTDAREIDDRLAEYEKKMDDRIAAMDARAEQAMEKSNNEDRKAEIEKYLKTLDLAASVDDVLADRQFVKNWISTVSSGLTASQRTKLAMAETYGSDTSYLTRKATAASTGGVIGTGGKAGTGKKKTLEDFSKMTLADFEADN